MEKLLTISVAAYNISNYIDKLMSSIIKIPALEAIEVLIINDGSTDDTAKKALEYQKEYPGSIRLINKENGGHGSTINRGIKEAKGKYFRALDGDDWVESDHLCELIKKLPEIEADIILSDYCECYEDGNRRIENVFKNLENNKCYSFDDAVKCLEWTHYHAVIYKTSFLQKHNIEIDEKCFYVDTELLFFSVPYVDSAYYYKPYIYCYRKGTAGQSVSNENRIRNIDDCERVTNRLIEFYNLRFNEMTAEKRQYCIRGIVAHCNFFYYSLMMIAPSSAIIRRINSFDRMLKHEVYDAYDALGKMSKAITMMRMTSGMAYALIYFYRKLTNRML